MYKAMLTNELLLAVCREEEPEVEDDDDEPDR